MISQLHLSGARFTDANLTLATLTGADKRSCLLAASSRGGTRLELDHYLEALLRKPRRPAWATALYQARSAGRFTPVHDAWWVAGTARISRASRLSAALLCAERAPVTFAELGIRRLYE
ncbi:hypothetical protein [Streptomyces aureus]|uniref:hypothetical protein n=1 Tax=Streptomyces aureus TaxID=193461 RepID=UPI0036AB95A8